MADEPLALSSWTETMRNLEQTPLLPIESIANLLQMMDPLWSKKPEWRELLNLADEAIAKREGRHAIGNRARDRALKLSEDGRYLDALAEFHQVKTEWWTGENVRGSLLSMLLIAKIYRRLQLPQAAKGYALAASYIAAVRNNEDLAHLIPAGILIAAESDFLSGAWYSATELYGLGIPMHYILAKNADKPEALDQAILHLAYANLCAASMAPEIATAVRANTSETGEQGVIDEATGNASKMSNEQWASLGPGEILAPPFADLGAERHIPFSALGTTWNITAANDFETVCLAERFAAAAQITMAEIARDDLCLLPTQIKVRIENKSKIPTTATENIEALPSNLGRRWIIRLAPANNANGSTVEDVADELAAMLVTIIGEISLLPEAEFVEKMGNAFKRGLKGNLSPGRPYDELAASVAEEKENREKVKRQQPPWGCEPRQCEAHPDLAWHNGLGPTYSRSKAEALIGYRYENFNGNLRITAPMLASSGEFQATVKTLREDGWLDWHILTAILNITMNFRFPASQSLPAPERIKQIEQEALRQESPDWEPVPTSLFTLDNMRESRHLSLIPLLQRWGLECRQITPDIPAIEHLLASRYGYWSDDIPHDDPFAEPQHAQNGLVVVKNQ